MKQTLAGPESHLKREIGRIGVATIAMNGVIGSGIFALPAVAIAQAGAFSPWLFPGETNAQSAIYAFLRDPVERFCSAVEFHKRCLANSFIQLFPERFVGIEPHPRWFETDPGAVAADLRAVINAVAPVEILAALPPPPVPGVSLQPRGGNLSFYRPQSEWLSGTAITILPFADYEAGLRQLVDQFGGDGASVEIPQINAAAGILPVLSMPEAELVRAYYREDLPL